MSIAAVPAYLGQDFKSAASGHRFNLYLQAWTEGSWERVRDNVANVVKGSQSLNDSDKHLLAGLASRQDALATQLESRGQLLRMDAVAVAPFATGLGNAHPLENGFAFLDPYGLPYLAGSGVKGVLRAAARELAAGEFGDTHGWSATDIDVLFGRDDESPGGIRRGALIFWDVLPKLTALALEIMNPHQSHYHQGGFSPHDAGSPVPIYFLSVPPGAQFVFNVQCQDAFLTHDLRTDARWKVLIEAALRHAFDWLGFGAKTAVGYGAMVEDREATEARCRARRAQEEERLRQEADARRQQALAAMSPLEREMQLIVEAPPPERPAHRKLIAELARGRWQGEAMQQVALHTRKVMEESHCWRPQSAKKNPARDDDHQDTLKVLNWLQNSNHR